MTPWVVIATIIGYFCVLLGISFLASRGSDNSTFFTGNRKTPWPIVAFAMIGAAISGVTFISVPGMVVNSGYGYLQMVLGFIVGYFVIAYILVPMFYRRNLVSIYGYLGERFGASTYKSGAWFFFISKMLGASVRFLVVCLVLNTLVFKPLGIPFEINVLVTIALIWLYTFNGGVKAIIWTDMLKSFCLIMSVVLCIYFVAKGLGFSFGEMVNAVVADKSSQMFFFDDPKAGTYFWKQFLAGVFMVIATTGLDQDMMQRNLACKDSKESQKNMIVSGVLQFFVIALFLILGTLLVMYLNNRGIAIPEKTDEIFGLVAASPEMPLIVGILFIVGLIAAAYSAAGSALTSLTTSFTVDILEGQKRFDESRLTRIRKFVHVGMSVVMGLVIIIFYYLSNQDAISAVYTLASYTYGPILGLFVFGMFSKRRVIDRLVPVVCIAAPVASWFIQYYLNELWQYKVSFELLIINALLTVVGMFILSVGKKQN
ncbi:MAG: sodium:solute symporter [Muribaculaceae bacterium]|jgi:SSS family transporter|nr:sodium:solute symporter [Muribaculaceae bacterium]